MNTFLSVFQGGSSISRGLDSNCQWLVTSYTYFLLLGFLQLVLQETKDLPFLILALQSWKDFKMEATEKKTQQK